MNFHSPLVWIIIILNRNYGSGDWELKCNEVLVGTLSTTGGSSGSRQTSLRFEVSQTLGNKEDAERAVNDHACKLYFNRKLMEFERIEVSTSTDTAAS